MPFILREEWDFTAQPDLECGKFTFHISGMAANPKPYIVGRIEEDDRIKKINSAGLGIISPKCDS